MHFNIHSEFELNGTSFPSKRELLLFSRTVSNPMFSFLSDFLKDSDTISVQTSGSTGTPKKIDIRKEHMINSARATGEFFDIKEETTALLCMNSEFIAGKMMLVRAMVLGWKLDIVGASHTPLKSIEKSYDFSAMVPLQVYNSLDELYKIKKLIIGGGVVSKELEIKLQSIKTEVYATYGMTETITHIAVRRLNGKRLKMKDNRDLTSIREVTMKQPLYKTLPNISISKDKRDCLVIDAPKVSNTRIVTNDMVELISETEFHWLGRYDTIINSGGIKLIPEQIEEKLAEIISERFFVAGIKDSVLGEKLILVVEYNVSSSLSTSLKINSVEKSQSIRNCISKLNSLSKYETPKEIYFLEKFVETNTKKIQRKKTLDLIDLFGS